MSRKVIELTEDMVINERGFMRVMKKAFWWSTFSSIFLIATGFSLVVFVRPWLVGKVNQADSYVNEQFREVKYFIGDKLDLVRYETRIIPAEEANYEDIVDDTAREYNMDASIGYVITDGESSFNPLRVREEKSWREDPYLQKKFPKQAWMNPIEYELIFSSYGLMQVSFPWWGKYCGISNPFQLLDPRTNVRCGMKIMKDCLGDQPDNSRKWLCFRKFNGGPNPTSEASAHYADEKMEKLKLLTSYITRAVKSHRPTEIQAASSSKKSYGDEIVRQVEEREAREEKISYSEPRLSMSESPSGDLQFVSSDAPDVIIVPPKKKRSN